MSCKKASESGRQSSFASSINLRKNLIKIKDDPKIATRKVFYLEIYNLYLYSHNHKCVTGNLRYLMLSRRLN